MNTEPLFEYNRFNQELGRTVPINGVLHRTRRLAVIAGSFIAYTTGFSFVFYTVQRNPPKYVRGVSRWSNLGVDHKTLMIVDGGGRSLPNEPAYVGKPVAYRFFVLDLPEPGPMTIGFDWPGRRSIRVSATLDASPILEASARAAPLW